jgi:hypothetical protein
MFPLLNRHCCCVHLRLEQATHRPRLTKRYRTLSNKKSLIKDVHARCHLMYFPRRLVEYGLNHNGELLKGGWSVLEYGGRRSLSMSHFHCEAEVQREELEIRPPAPSTSWPRSCRPPTYSRPTHTTI